ncbi:MAG: hypothetical protein QOD01_1244 [Actinomycetota bacterium]|nr:hypothetical protein [Actinomycetota bacterium]
MPHAENMVVIAAPITDVFAFIADGTNNPQWRPGVMDITPPDGGPEEGAVYGQGLRGPKGRRMDGDYRITDYQIPDRFAFEVIAGPARPTGSFDLEEPVAGATTVRFSLDLQAKGLMKVPMRFAGKIIERQMRAEVDCLSRLKDLFEGGPEEEEEAAEEEEAEVEAEPQA